jgi:hypothetical protein
MSTIRHFLTWSEALARLQPIIETVREEVKKEGRPISILGIPRNGAVIAGMIESEAGPGIVRVIRHDRADIARGCDYLIDGIADSGGTLARWEKMAVPRKGVWTLVNRFNEAEPLRHNWVVFPWESKS